MWPGRIAVAVVLLVSAGCFALVAVLFVNLPRMESPERYLAIALGLLLLWMGGSMLAGLIWPPKPKDPDAPIEIPPLDQVRGRTWYRDDSTMARNVMFLIGAIFLAASLGAAPEQPIVLVIAVLATGILAGAGVQAWRQFPFGRARLELDAPARRGDTMHGVITLSGSAWAAAVNDLRATVEVSALTGFSAGRRSYSRVVAATLAETTVVRDGNNVTLRFTTRIPVIDTSDGSFSWNVQVETETPPYRTTFAIDVA